MAITPLYALLSILYQFWDLLKLKDVSSEPQNCWKDFNMSIFLFFYFEDTR